MKLVHSSISFFLAIIVFNSCNNGTNTNSKKQLETNHNKTDSIKSVDSEMTTPYIPIFTEYIFDTAANILDILSQQYQQGPPKGKHWSELSDFWSIYNFGPDIYCIGLQLNYDTNTTVIDSIYASTMHGRGIRDSVNHDKIIDSVNSLQENQKLASAILQNDTTRWYYVYCTHGLTRAIINQVYYSNNGCVYFIALRLKGIDTVKYGQPVIAPLLKINLTYSSIVNFQHDLNEYSKHERSIHLSDYDWLNSTPPHLFAFNDSLFFTYTDNFKSESSYDSTHVIPERIIFIKHGDKVSIYSQNDVDLFGIPCD